MKINVHIDLLVLDGLPLERRDGPAVATAVQQELSRLFAEGHFTTSQAIAVAHGSPINLANSGTTALGQRIANSVHGGINK